MGKSVDVVVVGAGMAGLVAARDLVRGGADVLVLEARDRVGGRLLNDELPGGAPIEVGGQWVGPDQHLVHALIKELGLSTFPTYTEGRNIAEYGSSRSEYTGRFPSMNPLVAADLVQTQWRLDRLAREVAATDPWLANRAEELDGQTFATWLGRTAHTATGRSIFRMITQAVFAAEPEELSALWAAWYVGAAGGLDPLINVEGGAQQDRVVGGSHRIASAMAEELGDRIVFDAVVTAIEWTGSSVRVTAGNTTVTARRAVIALPPPLTTRIRFTPGLPSDRNQLVHRMSSGRVIKTHVVYDKPFWREAGLSGQANSDRRAVCTTFDNTPHEGSPAVLLAFIDGRQAEICARMAPAERRALVIDDLVGYFGPQARNPIAYMERDWAQEEFSGGCYHAFTSPGALTRYGPALRTPVGPLHWAGAETATRWVGSMEGAAESGHRVAREIAPELRGKGLQAPQ
ncbi:flavin monoamine oxidase family protein [Streptomyces vinaceus]|uniref:flavin monoamine oxidase family protein n=1 Tax=Streptomyces vinaceus TaxID=1960 RepID=UPI0036816656